jgi:Cellulase (glycosyl hydrolase family 5)
MRRFRRSRWVKYAREDADGHIDPIYLGKIEDKINSLTEKGIWVDLFVDSNCGQGSFEHDVVEFCGKSDDRRSAANFGNSTAKRTEFLELWAFLAERFSNHKRIGMYEILSEPNLGCSTEQVTCDYDVIPALYRPVIERIRAVDPATPVMVGATNTYDMENIASAYLDGVTNVIYTADILSNAAAQMPEVLKPALAFRNAKNVPIFIQQVGVKKADPSPRKHLDDTLAELAARQIGWTWWTYREPKARDGQGYAPYYIGDDNEWHEDLPWLNQITGYF